VRITGVDLNQKPVEIEATGWFARIFQHEFDHLDGILYVNRLAEPWKEISTDIIQDNGWAKPGLSWLPGKDKLDA
jgi:peptide deformylase